MAINSLGPDVESQMLKMPTPVMDAVRAAAAANYETAAAWMRRAVIDKLRAEGRLPQQESTP